MGHKDIRMTMNIYADVRKDDETVNEIVKAVWDWKVCQKYVKSRFGKKYWTKTPVFMRN